ncbi:hypothetical protein D3C86_1552530 [compost metagenome]
MAHQDDLRHPAAGQQAPVGGLVLGRVQTDPVHARIQLQPHRQRLAHGRALDGLDLPERMHHAPQLMLLDQRQFVGLEEAFQQQDGRADAGRAQLQRLFDAGHGETVGLAFQGLGTAHRTMPVGIGLDHRERLGARHFTGQSVVVTQGLQVDQGTGRTHG